MEDHKDCGTETLKCNQTSEALASRNPVDFSGSEMLPYKSVSTEGSVKRGFANIPDPELFDYGTDGNQFAREAAGGKFDEGGFLGRPRGFGR